MRFLLLAVALAFFGLGYAFGRDGSGSKKRRCPRCGHRRLHWCRGCGLHFDDDENPLTQREYDQLTSTEAFMTGDDEP